MNKKKKHTLKSLKKDKVICPFLWTHSYVEPNGNVFPCCTSKNTEAFTRPSKYGHVKDSTFDEIMRGQEMSKLRKKMLNGEFDSNCSNCYKTEKNGGYSFRTFGQDEFLDQDIVDYVNATNPENGEIEDYTFKYIDIRFSNVCNFRCKYCSPRFSSTWYNFMKDESEKHPVVRAYVKNNPMEIDLFKVQDVTKENLITQLTPHLDTTQQVYFGGGEPLITEEHYELLDVMMSKDLYDIHLRYNTNLSNFKYKKKHIFDYWENFQYLTIGCSLDHFGKKAEFMRTKTDWKVEEENLRELIKFRSNHYEIWGPHEELGDSQREHTKKWGKSGWVIISIDTVITIFNVGSITDFWDYLLDEKLLDDQMTVTINVTYTPEYFTVRALPKHLKDEFSKKMYDWWENVDERHPKLKTMKDVAGNLIKGEFKQYIDTIHNIMHSEDIWDEDLFFWKIKFLDPDMTFKKILPELSDCVDMDALADKVSDEAFMIASPTTLLK